MEITKVEPILSEQSRLIDNTHVINAANEAERQVERFNDSLLENQVGFSYFEIIAHFIKHPSLFKYTFNLLFGALMKKPIQIISAVIGIAGVIYKIIGGQEIPQEVTDGLTAVALFVWGLFVQTPESK